MINKFIFFTNEDGQALPLVALMLVVLIGFAALAIDIGMVAFQRADLQKAADAAALAGARDLPAETTAVDMAVSFAGKNGMKATQNNIKKDGDTVTVTTPYEGSNNKILVSCTRTVEYTFAKVLGFNNTDVTVKAVAERVGPNIEALKYTLFSGETIVTITSNKLSVINGDVYGNNGIDAPGAEIHGDAVASVGVSNINVSSATHEIGNRKEYLPDLWPLVSPINALTQAQFWALPNYNSVTKTFTMNNEVIRVADPKNENSWKELGLQGINFKGVGIIYNEGPIVLDGATQEPINTSIIYYSGDNANTAIHFTGSGQRYTGYLFAPNGGIKFSGTNAIVNGRAISKQNVWFSGGSVTVNGGIGESVFDLVNQRIRLIK